jgi:hypothetical protein
MNQESAAQQLDVARTHLERVRGAWLEPTNWGDLTIYGFYCLEATVMSAAIHLGMAIRRTHRDKAEAAYKLAQEHGLPDVSDLLWQLNDARKAVAYGDIEFPELDAEDVASQIELYFEIVQEFIETPVQES